MHGKTGTGARPTWEPGTGRCRIAAGGSSTHTACSPTCGKQGRGKGRRLGLACADAQWVWASRASCVDRAWTQKRTQALHRFVHHCPILSCLKGRATGLGSSMETTHDIHGLSDHGKSNDKPQHPSTGVFWPDRRPRGSSAAGLRGLTPEEIRHESLGVH